MTIFTDGPRLEPLDRTLDHYDASMGEMLSATAKTKFLESPLASIYSLTELGAAHGGDREMPAVDGLGNALGLPRDMTPNAPLVPQTSREVAQARVKEEGLESHLKLPDTDTIATPALEIMISRARGRYQRELTAEHGPGGVVAGALDVGTGFLVGAIDPVNVGLAFIPVVGEARYAKLLASAGEGAMRRAGMRAGVGMLEGGIGITPTIPLSWAARTQEGQEYGGAEALMDMVYGAGLGSAFRAGGGRVADFYRNRKGKSLYPFAEGETYDPAIVALREYAARGGADVTGAGAGSPDAAGGPLGGAAADGTSAAAGDGSGPAGPAEGAGGIPPAGHNETPAGLVPGTRGYQAAREELQDLIKGGATAEQIKDHPLVRQTLEEDSARPHTTELEGYGTPEFKVSRPYNIDGQVVRGFDNATSYLETQAKGYAGEAGVENNGVVTFVIGPPAAGKSTIAERIAHETRSAIVDPDDAKKIIPEYAGGRGTSATHEESSELAADVLRRMTQQNANLVLPRVGNNAEKLRAQVKMMETLGYKVRVVNMTVDPDEAYRRMIGRFLSSGRIIGSEYFSSVGTKPRESYYTLKSEGTFTDGLDVDANGGFGQYRILDGQDATLAQYFAPESGPGRGVGGQVDGGAAAGGEPPRGSQIAERVDDEFDRAANEIIEDALERQALSLEPPSPAVAAILDLPPAAQRDAMRAAVAAIIEGQPVRVEELLDAAAATGDRRIAEVMNDYRANVERVREESFEAWHGSPHIFDAFDVEKIGTGEGAQAYGHGLYFAEKKEVAEHYSKMAPVRASGAEALARSTLLDVNGDRAKAISQLRDWAETGPEKYAVIRRAAADELESGKDFGSPNLYRVRIKGRADQYLDLDKPLTELPGAMQARLAAVLEKHGIDIPETLGKVPDWLALETGRSDFVPTGRWAYDKLAEALKTMKKRPPDERGFYTFDEGKESASAALAEAGIPGLRYLDQGSRVEKLERDIRAYTARVGELEQMRAKLPEGNAQREGLSRAIESERAKIDEARNELEKDQTRNVVVFNHGDVEIVDRNGVSVAAAIESPIKNSVATFSPAELKVDAKRFQFKEGGDDSGVTDRLKGVTTWDPVKAGLVLVWEDKDGQRFIVDGHQRYGLATRIARADPAQNPQLLAHVLREVDGVSDIDARVVAAAKNIAEGTGTAVDAAKVLRDRPELRATLPPRSELVRQADGLVALDDEAFRMVINGVVPANYASIVGRMVPDDAKMQSALLELLAKTEPDNVVQAEAIVRQGREAGLHTETQASLFGDQDVATSLYSDRAKVLDRALKALKRDKTVFSTLVKEADTLQSAGNVLAIDENARRANADAQAVQLLQTLASRAGPISDALTAAARKSREERGYAGAVRDFVATVRREAESGDLARIADGRAERGVEAAPAGERVTSASEWFKGSVVTDENGLPLVVYRGEHGDLPDGETFQGRTSSLTFSTRDAAETYATSPNNRNDEVRAPRVAAAYLSIKKPVFDHRDDPYVDLSEIVEKFGREEAIRLARKNADHIRNTGAWEEGFADQFESVEDVIKRAPERLGELPVLAYAILDDDEFVRMAKTKGYDGAVHMGSGQTAADLEYRVFDRSQVRSAFAGPIRAAEPLPERVEADTAKVQRVLTEATEAGEQMVLPGAERSAVQAAAARDAYGMGPDVAQEEPGGLFAQAAERPQDLFDSSPAAQAKAFNDLMLEPTSDGDDVAEIVASRAVQREPAPASSAPEPDKRLSAAQRSLAEAELLYNDAAAYLPEELKLAVDDRIRSLDINMKDREDIYRQGAACLTGAAA